MNIFVKRSEKVEVEVYAWEENGNVEASSEKEGIPVDARIIKFQFRRPGHKDSVEISREAQMQSGDPDKMDAISFQDTILRLLLVDWDLSGEEGGKSMPVNAKNIGDLQPNIARAAVAGVLEKITI